MVVEVLGDGANPVERADVAARRDRPELRLGCSQEASRLVTERQKVAVRIGIEWHGRVIPGA